MAGESSVALPPDFRAYTAQCQKCSGLTFACAAGFVAGAKNEIGDHFVRGDVMGRMTPDEVRATKWCDCNQQKSLF